MRPSLLAPLALLLLPLAACGPAKSMTEGDDASASASDSETSTTGGLDTDSDTDSDTDTTGGVSDTDTDTATSSSSSSSTDTDTDTTGDVDLQLACDGAKWVRVHRLGEFNDVAVNSQGHVIAFGSLNHDGAPNDAILTDLDPSGALVRNVLYATTGSDYVLHGGVADDDEVYSLSIEKGAPRLRRHDPEGTLVWSVALDEGIATAFAPSDLAVGPDGSTVVSGLTEGGTTLVARFDVDGGLVWVKEYADYLEVQGMNGAGVIAAATADGVIALDGDGGVLWEATHPLFNIGKVAINASGAVVLAGDNEAGVLSVARFDGEGALIHDTLFNVYDGYDKISDVALSDIGEIAASGYIQAESPLTAFVVKISVDGELLDTHRCEEAPDSRGHAVAIDEAGGLYLDGAVGIEFDYYSFVAAF